MKLSELLNNYYYNKRRLDSKMDKCILIKKELGDNRQIILTALTI